LIKKFNITDKYREKLVINKIPFSYLKIVIVSFLHLMIKLGKLQKNRVNVRAQRWVC